MPYLLDPNFVYPVSRRGDNKSHVSGETGLRDGMIDEVYDPQQWLNNELVLSDETLKRECIMRCPRSWIPTLKGGVIPSVDTEGDVVPTKLYLNYAGFSSLKTVDGETINNPESIIHSKEINPVWDFSKIPLSDLKDATKKDWKKTATMPDFHTVASGDYTIGSAKDYATHIAAANDIDSGGLTGNLTFRQQTATSQGAPYTANFNKALSTYKLLLTNDFPHYGDPTSTVKIAQNHLECIAMRMTGSGGTMECEHLYIDGASGVDWARGYFIEGTGNYIIHDFLVRGKSGLTQSAWGIKSDGSTTASVIIYNGVIWQFNAGTNIGMDINHIDGPNKYENVVIEDCVNGFDFGSRAVLVANLWCWGCTNPYVSISGATGKNTTSDDTSNANGNWGTGSGNLTSQTATDHATTLDDSSSDFMDMKIGGDSQGAGVTNAITARTKCIRNRDVPGPAGTSIGAAEELVYKGSGGVNAPGATASGVGIAEVTGTGAISSPVATAAGTGEAGAEGTGAITGTTATASGDGLTGNVGPGAVTAPAATASGTGLLIFSGSGAISAPAATASGVGELIITGSGAITAPATTASGTGIYKTDGAGAITAPAATASGSGTYKIDGAGGVTSPSATASGTGELIITGTGAISAPVPTGSGTGLLIITGSGSITAPAVTASGTGVTGGAVGSGAIVGTVATGSGTGLLIISGSGGVTTPSATASGTGLLIITGSGAISGTVGTASGTGALIITGSGSITAPTSTASGTGALIFAGVGGVTAPTSTASGTGVSGGATGTGAISGTVPTANGTGLLIITGTGAITSVAGTADGTGESGIEGTGAIVGTVGTASGVGFSGNLGTGSVTSPASTASGTGELIITGSGSITAPAVTTTGTGFSGILGDGAIVGTVPTGSGTGEYISDLVGSGAITGPISTGSGSGQMVFSASGAIVGTVPTAIGIGAFEVFGSGGVTAPIVTTAGEIEVINVKQNIEIDSEIVESVTASSSII